MTKTFTHAGHDAELGRQLAAAVAALGRAESELAALRQVSRGYCPQCGRGDAAPTVQDWQQERDRAQRLAATLTDVLDRYKPHPAEGPVRGYISHPVDQAELDRWHAALDKEPTP